jgi:hypothetical protein
LSLGDLCKIKTPEKLLLMSVPTMQKEFSTNSFAQQLQLDLQKSANPIFE